MTWRFAPANDNCINCDRLIQFKRERNYIVWDSKAREYRRKCATCYDHDNQRPYERRASTDAMAKRLSNEGD